MITQVLFKPLGQTFEVFDREDNAWPPIQGAKHGGLLAGLLLDRWSHLQR